jgi:hypothetical protein
MDENNMKDLFKDDSIPLGEKLTQLNDSFIEYSEINAFLINAFSSTLSEHEWLNPEIISGARRCSIWLQSRTIQIKEELRHVHARYLSEQQDNQAPQ